VRRPDRRAALLLLPLAGMCLPLLAQDTEHEVKDTREKKDKGGWRFVWKKHPSVRAGEWLRVDFRARFQMDWVEYDPEVKRTPDLFRFGRRRLAVEGHLLRVFEYEVSREFAETDFAWKDVYVNYRPRRGFQLRGGRFRIPFSLDQLTGPTELDYIERSRIGDRLAPGRDTGFMLHGSPAGRVRYQAGWFFNDGDNSANNQNVRTGHGAFAGRFTASPFEAKRFPALLQTLTVGAAGTTSRVEEGLHSLRGRTVSRETFFPYFFVKGRRERGGVELSWMPGPFSLKSEYVGVREQRLGQSLFGGDLSDLLSRGWYVSGTWVVTGQSKARGLSRGREVPFLQGIGAVELATRYEALRYSSDGGLGNPTRSTRGDRLIPTSDRLWTWGVNLYLNQWAKFQANFVREHLEDAFRAPIQGQRIFWTYKFRLQLAL
jgi:phosphate-selective porin OprO/OprP